MKKHIVCILAAVFVLLPASADGQPPTCPLSKDAGGRATAAKSGRLCVDGALGHWFPSDAATRLLIDVRKGKNAQVQLELTQDRLKLGKKRTTLLDMQLTATKDVAATWKSAAEQQAKAAARSRSVWRSPTLWFAVGVVITAGAFSAAVGTR